MKKHTQKSVREACLPLAQNEREIVVGRVLVTRIGAPSGVSLGNVHVHVASEGRHITDGRFNQVIGAILHEANRGS